MSNTFTIALHCIFTKYFKNNDLAIQIIIVLQFLIVLVFTIETIFSMNLLVTERVYLLYHCELITLLFLLLQCFYAHVV